MASNAENVSIWWRHHVNHMNCAVNLMLPNYTGNYYQQDEDTPQVSFGLCIAVTTVAKHLLSMEPADWTKLINMFKACDPKT